MFRTNQGRGSNGHGVALFSGSLVAESANATNLQVTTQPGLSGATPYTLSPQPVVTAKKSLGTTDSAYVTNVVASLNVLSGSPVLSGTTTKTPVSGVATFTDLVVTGAGTWTLTFTSGSLASAVSSTGTTTSSSAATKLTITTAPGLSGTTPYTLSPQPVVAAQNGSSVTDTGYVTNVVAALNVLTGSPVLSGTTTKTPVSGVATFTDLVVTGAGTWTITFTSGSLTSATSSTGTTTSGGPTTLAADTFNRTSGTIGTASDGGTWGGFPSSFSCNGTQLTTTTANAYVSRDAGQSDYTVSIKIVDTQSCHASLRWRMTDTNNYYSLHFNGTTSFILWKNVAGTPAFVTASPSNIVTVANGDTISVTVAGTTHTVKVNGTTVATFTDSDLPTGQLCGPDVLGISGTAIYDDFLVTT